MRSKGDENMRKRAFKQCLLSCFASYASTYVYIYAMELCLIETVALQAKQLKVEKRPLFQNSHVYEKVQHNPGFFV